MNKLIRGVVFYKKRDKLTGTHLKNRILVQDCGGAEFKTGGILLYVEDFKRGTNKDIGPKDIFEMGSNKIRSMSGSLITDDL